MASGSEKLKVDPLTLSTVDSASLSLEYKYSPLVQDVTSSDPKGVTLAERGLRLSVMAVYAYKCLWNKTDPKVNPKPDYEALMMNQMDEPIPRVDERLANVCIKLLYYAYMKATSPNG